MTQDGTIIMFVDDYDRLHFRILPANGKRVGTPRGRLSPQEAHLRRQLYAIPGQDSPDLWVPPRQMSKAYYEFTTRLMPPERPLSSPMITHRVLEGQQALKFKHEIPKVIAEALGWQDCEIITTPTSRRSVFKDLLARFRR